MRMQRVRGVGMLVIVTVGIGLSLVLPSRGTRVASAGDGEESCQIEPRVVSTAAALNDPTFATPTDDPVQFNADWFNPLLNEMYETYPLEPVRKEIVRFMDRNQRNEIDIEFILTGAPDVMTIAISGVDESGRLSTQFFGENLIGYAKGCEWQIPCLEDMLAHTVVHEQYHLDHHVKPHDFSAPSAAQMRTGESEAWWYSTEHALVPMALGGRLSRIQHGGPLERALDAFFEAKHDPNSPAWQSFVDYVTAEPPPATSP